MAGREQGEREESVSWGMWDGKSWERRQSESRAERCQKGGNVGGKTGRGDLGEENE